MFCISLHSKKYRVIDNILLSSRCAHRHQITFQAFRPKLLMTRLDTIRQDTGYSRFRPIRAVIQNTREWDDTTG